MPQDDKVGEVDFLRVLRETLHPLHDDGTPQVRTALDLIGDRIIALMSAPSAERANETSYKEKLDNSFVGPASSELPKNPMRPECVAAGCQFESFAASAIGPSLTPLQVEQLTATASFLELLAVKVTEPPANGYTHPRTIEVGVWDNCDAGGEAVDSFTFDEGEADLLASLIRAALKARSEQGAK